jgi:predicted amidohydrolase
MEVFHRFRHEVFTMSAPMLRVATIPLVSLRGDTSRNVGQVADWLALAAREQIGLAVFPEACLVGRGNLATLHRRELDAQAESLDGPSVSAVAQAVENTGVAAGVGLIERSEDGRLFNSYVICMPDGQRYCHRKLHAFEHRRIECGDRFTVFDSAWGVRIGILIGADNYLIENVRTTALMGATLLIAPHRRYGKNEPAHWSSRGLPARADDNGMFVAFSDSVDAAGEHEQRPTQTAMILDPCGRVLAQSAGESRAIVCADLDSALIGKSMGRQWLSRRRPSLYGPLIRTSGQASAIAETPGIRRAGSVAVSFAVVGRERLLR